MDEVDLSLSEEDTSAILPNENSPAALAVEMDVPPDVDKSQSGIKPNFVYVNTTDEDTMVVQHILSTRTGTREIESSDDEDDEDDKQKEKEKEKEKEQEKEKENEHENEKPKEERIELKGLLFIFIYFLFDLS